MSENIDNEEPVVDLDDVIKTIVMSIIAAIGMLAGTMILLLHTPAPVPFYAIGAFIAYMFGIDLLYHTPVGMLFLNIAALATPILIYVINLG